MATSIQETVLIGICDGAIDKMKNTSYSTNKIGDRPDLLPVINLQYPSCTQCQRGLSHVVQVYCPLSASPYHRTLNVFACSNPQCYGKSESWMVLRSQCLDDDTKDYKTSPCVQSAMSGTDWCDEADDWGMDDEEQDKAKSAVQMPCCNTSEGTDVSSKLQDLCIDGSADHPRTPQPTNVPVFKPFYISVMEETDLDGFQDMDHENELLREYEEREGVNVEEIRSCESSEAKEEYEKATAKHGDAVFTGFMKKISLCPKQILRYSWNGSPLFIMKPPCNASEMVPRCSHCGSQRVFEFQLMPALVSLLGSADTNSGPVPQPKGWRDKQANMISPVAGSTLFHLLFHPRMLFDEISLEFGTVLVYTCRNSCWKSGSTVPVEEFLFVQPDPDQKLFK